MSAISNELLTLLQATAPLNRFVYTEVATVMEMKGNPIPQFTEQALWWMDQTWQKGLFEYDREKVEYQLSGSAHNILENNGGIDEDWINRVDSWAASYYVELAARFENSELGSARERIYNRASDNVIFHQNRIAQKT